MADHPLYVVSIGDDHLYVEVEVHPSLAHVGDRRGQRLVTMQRASYDRRTHGDLPVLRLHTSWSGVVDFEHDTSKFALVEVALPHPTYDSAHRREFVGVIHDVRLYPAGVDPMAQSDRDTEAGQCDQCRPGHLFAPYLPPERPETNALVGQAVTVTIMPQALRDERDDE